MDASVLDDFIDVSSLRYTISMHNHKLYKVFNNINSVVLWDAIFFKLLKQLKARGITVSQAIIDTCAHEYARFEMRIDVAQNTIDIPKSMQDVINMLYLHEAKTFPSLFVDIAWAGIGLWILIRLAGIFDERKKGKASQPQVLAPIGS